MAGKPDFEALRKERNIKVREELEEVAKKMNIKGVLHHNFDWNACYCACPEGPCEHNWEGWREIENGGERFCTRCKMGAMSHTLRTAE